MASYRIFDEVPPDKHKEVAIKAIKFCLKNYYKLDEEMYPSTGAVKTENMSSYHPGDTFCLKVDIDNAINQLPLNLRKIILMAFIVGLPVSKVCAMLGFKFRVDFYRSLDNAFSEIYAYLGTNWLKN